MSDLLRQDHPVEAPGELVAVTGLPNAHMHWEEWKFASST